MDLDFGDYHRSLASRSSSFRVSESLFLCSSVLSKPEFIPVSVSKQWPVVCYILTVDYSEDTVRTR